MSAAFTKAEVAATADSGTPVKQQACAQPYAWLPRVLGQHERVRPLRVSRRCRA
jgi:hypothetical protein